MVQNKSELILNEDGTIYHLHLKPEHIANNIIFVGDQDRVEKVSKHFDTIEFTIQKREFKTVTGSFKNKRFTVISTGIGPDNIDIVINELDALVNIDLVTKKAKPKVTSLNIARIGTSGALQADIPIDNFLLSEYAIDLNGMLRAYKTDEIAHPELEDAFVAHTNWCSKKAYPLVVANSSELAKKLEGSSIYKGITATAGGFYGPQGRILRLAIQDNNINKKIDSFTYQNKRITNLEMETSAIYGLSKLLGHNACSINAILANRANGTFSKNPTKTIEELIEYTLYKLVE